MASEILFNPNINYAYINTSPLPPYKNYVVKSVETVLSQVYLNKLWIPDVLIDIIKDFLYISAEEILRKFHKSQINLSIERLTIESYNYLDEYGRKRLTHWVIGHTSILHCEIQLQQTLCVTCGENCINHPNINGCCVLEWDGEDGTLDFTPEVLNGTDTQEEQEVVAVEQEEAHMEEITERFYDRDEERDDYYDGYDSDV